MEFTETVKKILKHIDDLNIQRNTDKFSHIVKLIKGDEEPDEFEKPLIDEILKYVRSDEYKGEDILGMFFNEFNYLQKKHDKGQVFTPKHIADLICKTMDITEEDSILDAACGTGILLTSTIPYKVRGLYGVEFTEDIAEMAAANMTIRSDVVAEVISGDTRSTEISDWIKSKAITKVLMMFEPKILVIARSVVPCATDIIFTTNSGIEVPNATTVRPMIRSLIPNRLAIADAPSTNQSAPFTKATKPMVISTIATHMP